MCKENLHSVIIVLVVVVLVAYAVRRFTDGPEIPGFITVFTAISGFAVAMVVALRGSRKKGDASGESDVKHGGT